MLICSVHGRMDVWWLQKILLQHLRGLTVVTDQWKKKLS